MGIFYLVLLRILGFFISLVVLSIQYKHFLSILLSLEGITIRIFIILFCVSNRISFRGEICLILLTLGACEARLGLSVLVSIVRVKGNDYVFRFSSQKC